MTVHQKRKKNIRSGISRHKRFAIFSMDSHQCVYCGEPGSTLDHVAPVSLVCEVWPMKSINHPSNLVTACQSCNFLRRDRIGMQLVMMFGRFAMNPTNFHKYQQRVVADLSPNDREWLSVASQ